MLGIRELLNWSDSASPSAQAPATDPLAENLPSELSPNDASNESSNEGTSTPEPTSMSDTNTEMNGVENKKENVQKGKFQKINNLPFKKINPSQKNTHNNLPHSVMPETSKFASKVESEPGLTINTSGRRVSKLHRSRIHPHALRNVRLIDIALRRKSSVKRVSNPDTFGSKLHRKFLEAGLRVRLVSCPSIYEIFRQLTPATSRGQTLFSMEFDNSSASLKAYNLSAELHHARLSYPPGKQKLEGGRNEGGRNDPARSDKRQKIKRESDTHENGSFQQPMASSQDVSFKSEPSDMDYDVSQEPTDPFRNTSSGISQNTSNTSQEMSQEMSHIPGNSEQKPLGSQLARYLPSVLQTGKLDTRVIRLIDNNLVDLAGVPSKVLKSLRYDSDIHGIQPHDLVGTFNCLDTAVASVFKIHQYSLVRVTKSASTNSEPSVLVKLETAHPGDPSLIDDGEYIEDMVTSLGRPNSSPSNLFLKKVVARPRYKVDMKLYFIPSAEAMSLYVDSRILERDLINGVVDVNSEPDRMLYTTFDPGPVLQHVQHLISKSDRLVNSHPEDLSSHPVQVPNHITDNIQSYMCRSPSYADSEGYSSGSSSNSRSSVFSRASSSGSTSSGSTSVDIEKP